MIRWFLGTCHTPGAGAGCGRVHPGASSRICPSMPSVSSYIFGVETTGGGYPRALEAQSHLGLPGQGCDQVLGYSVSSPHHYPIITLSGVGAAVAVSFSQLCTGCSRRLGTVAGTARIGRLRIGSLVVWALCGCAAAGWKQSLARCPAQGAWCMTLA